MIKMKLKHIKLIYLLKEQINKLEDSKTILLFNNKIHKILKITTNSFNSRWVIYKTITVENELKTICNNLIKLGINIV